MPDKRVVESSHVPRLGPYSQAVLAGDLIFTSGLVGVDPATGKPAGDAFLPQARQAFKDLRALLVDAGSGMERVVKTTCYLAEPDAFAQLNDLFAEFFPQQPPVRSTLIVALPRGMKFSIDAIAMAGGERPA